MFPHLQSEPPAFKSTPPSWRAPNPRKAARSHLTTRHSRMCSINRQPPNYHHIGHGTVLLTCCLEFSPPEGRIYPLSIPERKAMENYIKEALQQGLIHPSTSPAASSTFFLGKKGGGLRPYVDYRALNEHTVKLPYALPLVPAALEELHGAHIFSKLDLRSAYNLVRIWEGNKWKTVLTTPAGHYEYQIMLDGLSNSSSINQGFMNEVFLMLCCFFFTLYSSKKKLAHVTKTIKQHNS